MLWGGIGKIQKGSNFLNGMFMCFGGSFTDGVYLEGGIRKHLASPLRGEILKVLWFKI